MRKLAPVLALCLSACAIADRSDKFGASLDIGVGGIIGYIADVRFKADVGFSKTCTHDEEGARGEDQDAGHHAADAIGHFL